MCTSALGLITIVVFARRKSSVIKHTTYQTCVPIRIHRLRIAFSNQYKIVLCVCLKCREPDGIRSEHSEVVVITKRLVKTWIDSANQWGQSWLASWLQTCCLHFCSQRYLDIYFPTRHFFGFAWANSKHTLCSIDVQQRAPRPCLRVSKHRNKANSFMIKSLSCPFC